MNNEPVVTAAVVSGIIVSLASVFNIVIDPDTVTTVVAALLPVVLALFARQKVTPVEPTL
jgi:hypothetical protein